MSSSKKLKASKKNYRNVQILVTSDNRVARGVAIDTDSVPLFKHQQGERSDSLNQEKA